MSRDDDKHHHGHAHPVSPPPVVASPAADVTFAAIDAGHRRQHDSPDRAASTPRTHSRGSSAKGSAHKMTDLRKDTSNGKDGGSHKSSKMRHDSKSRRSGRSDGFLLNSIFSNGKAKKQVPTPPRDSHSPVPSRSKGSYRTSGESSQRNSSLSRAITKASIDSAPGAGTKVPETPSQTSIDPAQLVQMALNLSESRKLHAGNTLPVVLPPAGGRRIVSALDSGYATVRSASSGGKRASSYNDMGASLNPALQQDLQHHDMSNGNGLDFNPNVLYTFSPATLSRAEKARRYFELASEHRRLLEHLPPLKPDAKALGNHTIRAKSSPGSAHYEVTRVPSSRHNKHVLGRAYNPLQSLRNRRLRNRERRPLTAPPDTFQETERIKRWIDGVEAMSKESSYRPGDDQVRLPQFSGELEGTANTTGRIASHHRRSETASSVIPRPENGWTIEPAELLADTYWVEKEDNKFIIEDRHGNRIFPARAHASLEVPREPQRRSKEIDRRSVVNGGKQAEDSSDDERSKNRRSKLPLPGRLRRNHHSRSGSVSTVSSAEGRKPPPPRFGHDEGGDENIGPLERHMREMIAKEEKGELLPPEPASPNPWNSSNVPHPRSSIDKQRQESVVTANARLSGDIPRHRRSQSVERRISTADRGMSSMDELVSNSPSSLVMPGFVQMDQPQMSNEQSSPVRPKSKGLRMPHFRSHSKDRNNIEQQDFAPHQSVPLSPVYSAGAESSSVQARSSIESTRPHFRRHRTTDSNASSLFRAPDGSGKETKSAARGFFKTGRLGELVRNESSRLGDRLRGSREGVNSDASVPPSDVSDIENDRGPRRRRTDESADEPISPRHSVERERQNSKFFTANLPSFKSPGGRGGKDTISPMSEDSDPFERLRTVPRAKHGDLPRIKLPDDEPGNVSEPGMSPSKANGPLRVQYDERKSISHSNLAFVETGAILPKHRGNNTGDRGKRHWSISDYARRSGQTEAVTARDIARARALLLASGIKAHEIYNKTSTVRIPPSPTTCKAAETAGREVGTVTCQQENAVAAQMLSESLDRTVSDFEKSLEGFQTGTTRQLGLQLDELSRKATDRLTKLVQEMSDEADAFNVELTTKVPQDLKRVDEAIDEMFRLRRRQFRMLRRTGFKLLEWLLLGIMWWVWFVVVVVNTFRKCFVFGVRTVKWLVWF